MTMSINSSFLVPSGHVQPSTPEVLGHIERRWEGLSQRVESKLRSIRGVDRRQELRLLDQAAKASTVPKKVMWLRKAAAVLTEGAAPLAACRKGCSHCCRIAVVISRAEAQVIARETGARMNQSAGKFTMSNVDEDEGASYKAATREAFGMPCTFLTDDGCSAYSSRPLQCRLLLNMDEDALLCQLVEGGTVNVPYLNTQSHHIDSVLILGAHQDYDDIRSWFPERA